MALRTDVDSAVGHSFGLEFDGITIKQIPEVTGLKMDQDVIELKHNTTDGKYLDQEAAGPAQGRRGHPHPGPDRRQQLRDLDQEVASSATWATPARAGRSSSTTTRATAIKRYKLENCLAQGRWRSAPSRRATRRCSPRSSPSPTKAMRARVRRGASRLWRGRADPPEAPEPAGEAAAAGWPAVGAERRCGPSSSSSCPGATSTRPAPLHRRGSMRLATARDELLPLHDDRVRENPAYLTVVLLARVVDPAGDAHRRPRRRHGEPLRLRPGLPPGPLPPGQPGGPHPGRGHLPGVQPPVRGRRGRWSPGGIVTYGGRTASTRRSRTSPTTSTGRWTNPRPRAPVRRRFVDEIAKINRRVAAGQ